MKDLNLKCMLGTLLNCSTKVEVPEGNQWVLLLIRCNSFHCWLQCIDKFEMNKRLIHMVHNFAEQTRTYKWQYENTFLQSEKHCKATNWIFTENIPLVGARIAPTIFFNNKHKISGNNYRYTFYLSEPLRQSM